jgi:glutamine amidotransferase
MTIAIIDYGAGNLRSVQKALELVGADAVLTDDANTIRESSAVVFPGVGAFKSGYRGLEDRGLVPAIKDSIQSGKPFLGICLGLQLLFEESEEDGPTPGLGILPGRVVRFTGDMKIPHMGWNRLQPKTRVPLFEGVPEGTYFYFVHSYYVLPDDVNVTAATTDYGVEFTSMVARDNLFAVQFHPEKSQKWGLKILENFHRMVSEEGGEGGSRGRA